MGKKIGSGEISIVTGIQKRSGVGFWSFGGFGLMLCLALNGFPKSAQAKWSELSLQFNYRLMDEPLTLEKTWKLDPEQPNPHLQRWITQRKTEIIGLQVIPKPSHHYGVKANGLSTQVSGHVRDLGPWFQSYDKFKCEKKPNSWFYTHEGAKKSATLAADLWNTQLDNEKIKLSLLLDRVSEKTPERAIARGKQVFETWLNRADWEWRRTYPLKVRDSEWQNYLEEAAAQKLCPAQKTLKGSPPSIRSMMQPVSGEPLPVTALLARAPARRWDGLFSVRLSIEVGQRKLIGQFLIDSAAKMSIVSPVWLESQGIYPSLITLPGIPPKRVSWSGGWETESLLAPVISLDRISIGGLTLPLNELLLAETEFFWPPDSVGTCCDGVLGLDFLKLFPVEFQTEIPFEVRVWPREGFRHNEESPWVEIRESSRGHFISSCFTASEYPKQKDKIHYLPGILWETGTDESLLIHTPWQTYAKNGVLNPTKPTWKVQCDSLEFARGVQASFPKTFESSEEKSTFNLEIPAVSIGMGLLSRGNFTFDLPHGRLWFSKNGMNLSGARKNESGLKLKYILKDGDRVLKVNQIRPKSAAAELVKLGLRPGSVITQVDSKDASEMDYWEVDRRLSGEYGEVVALQWMTKQGLKTASLKVKF